MYDVSMEVQLTDDQKAFVRQGIEMGQCSHEENAGLAHEIHELGMARLAAEAN